MSEREKADLGGLSEKATSLIPDFFFDIIARIIPGAVLLWLYWPNTIEKAVGWGGVVSCALACWVIGLVLDHVTYTLAKAPFVLYALAKAALLRFGLPKKAFVPLLFIEKWEEQLFDLPSPGIDPFSPSGRRNIVLRSLAERVFLRVLVCIAVVAWLVPPVGAESPSLVEDEVSILFEVSLKYGLHWIVAAGALMWAWYVRRRDLRAVMERQRIEEAEHAIRKLALLTKRAEMELRI